MRHVRGTVMIGALTGLLSVTTLTAQSVTELAVRFAGMTAVSGLEQSMVDSLLALLPGGVRDRAGSVVLTVGSGEPKRLIACALDEAGYVVGRIHEDGRLSLRRVGRAPSPLFDQSLESHRVAVWTRDGARSGVVATPSTHLARGRRQSWPLFTVDDVLVDVGAASPAEVGTLGIALLNPVALEKTPHRYGADLLAAPEAAQRGACAALAWTALGAPPSEGTVVVAFLVESRIRNRGLFTMGNVAGPFTSTVLLNYPRLRSVPGALGEVEHWHVPARYERTAVETVRLGDVEDMAGRIRSWMGGGR